MAGILLGNLSVTRDRGSAELFVAQAVAFGGRSYLVVYQILRDGASIEVAQIKYRGVLGSKIQ